MARRAEQRVACAWCEATPRPCNVERHLLRHWCVRCERFHTQRGFVIAHGLGSDAWLAGRAVFGVAP